MALTDNLVSFWELDSLNDAHGSNHLTDHNSVPFVSGKVGNCGDFESGSSQYLDVADNAGLSTGNVDFTVIAWVNLESLGNQIIVEKGNGTDYEFQLYYSAGGNRFRFFVSAGGATFIDVAANDFGGISTGTWYFLVGWHDSVNDLVGISVNDVDTSGIYSGGSQDTNGSFKIGADGNGPSLFADGLIDQVGFFKRVVGDADRTSLFNSGNGLSYAAMGGGGGATARKRPSSRGLLGVGR